MHLRLLLFSLLVIHALYGMNPPHDSQQKSSQLVLIKDCAGQTFHITPECAHVVMPHHYETFYKQHEAFYQQKSCYMKFRNKQWRCINFKKKIKKTTQQSVAVAYNDIALLWNIYQGSTLPEAQNINDLIEIACYLGSDIRILQRLTVHGKKLLSFKQQHKAIQEPIGLNTINQIVSTTTDDVLSYELYSEHLPLLHLDLSNKALFSLKGLNKLLYKLFESKYHQIVMNPSHDPLEEYLHRDYSQLKKQNKNDSTISKHIFKRFCSLISHITLDNNCFEQLNLHKIYKKMPGIKTISARNNAINEVRATRNFYRWNLQNIHLEDNKLDAIPFINCSNHNLHLKGNPLCFMYQANIYLGKQFFDSHRISN